MVRTRKTRGRQKIEMIKIANEGNLQVTFSKRRNSLFKKASELCTLTGSEVALVVFSPGDKAYSFGSPNVNAAIHRYESHVSQSHPNPNPNPNPNPVVGSYSSPSSLVLEAHRRACLSSLNQELEALENGLEQEKKKCKSIREKLKENNPEPPQWWEVPIEQLEYKQVEQLKFAMEEIMRKVQTQSSFTSTGYAGPYLINNTIFIKGRPAFDRATYGSGSPSTSTVPFDPNSSGFGGVQMRARPPYAYQFFN